MRVLVLNSGSSSLKFRIVEVGCEKKSEHACPTMVMGGEVSGIGGTATLRLQKGGSEVVTAEHQIRDHGEAVRWVFEQVGQEHVEAVGHRVVHGGERFSVSTTITAEVIDEITRLSELAPLHNPASIAGIRAARAAVGPAIPMVAVFDTAFHHTLPEHARTYAIPPEIASRYGIRRYGFHGIAHASLAAGYAACTERSLAQSRLITLHLGNGCSASAVMNGRSIDTSMGLTPLEGLVMGTRSGDLDPSVISYLARRDHVAPEMSERWLNESSGLLGVSGVSHDMRRLLEEEAHNPRAALAVTLFCYRARKYIGAYLAVLGGANAIIFGGGIGEHQPTIRGRICAEMDWCGVTIDHARNARVVALASGLAARISHDESQVAVYVVAADEETWIARETVSCLLDDQ